MAGQGDDALMVAEAFARGGMAADGVGLNGGGSSPVAPFGAAGALAVLRDILDALPSAAMLLADTDAPCLANATARSLFGLTPGQSVTRASLRAALAPLGEAVLPMIDEATRGERPAPLTVLMETPAQWLDVRAVPIGLDMVLLLATDVTERRRLARSLDDDARRSADLAARVEEDSRHLDQIVEERARVLAAREEGAARDRRLASIGQLAAGVMHDVNNALNPIMAAAFLLQHHADNPDAVRDYADRIRTAAEMGAATAARVGRFIRQEPLDAGMDDLIDLSTLAEEVLQLTESLRQRRASDGGEVHVVRAYHDGVTMRGVAGEIREALFNLVANAMDAMPLGGTLTIRTGHAGAEVLVIVEDTGTGMSAETRERAFEPFYTTKGAGGTGLGLAEVYGVARRHRGSVSIRSELGIGTAVTLHFPADRATTSAAPAAVSARARPLRILVVEDHDDGRDFLCRVLRIDGHHVDAVASVGGAITCLEGPDGAQIEFLLTDVGLPDGSGWDLVLRAKAMHPALRVGVITGWEPAENSAETVGAEFVLRKPLRAAELLAQIAGRPVPAPPLT